MNLRYFITIQGCPVFADIGPYIAVCINDAHAEIASIYRGDDARAILNRHDKHSQFQLVHATPAERIAWQILGTPNPVGHSTHELFSDGRAFPQFPDGTRLPWWCQGFDVPDIYVEAVIAAAAKHGWKLFRPYGPGVEFHHLCFEHEPTRPKPGTIMWARIWRIRATYPRS